MYKVFDFHSDLLEYLELDPSRTLFDPESLSSYLQLEMGNVKIQNLALFAPTKKNSTVHATKQKDLFIEIKSFVEMLPKNRQILFIPSIENSSCFAEEHEPFSLIKKRVKKWHDELHFFSISLTWNSENRFGGGALTKIGLKEDGMRLLDLMAEERIAIDLSHASDQLAFNIINYIDKKHLSLPLLATHSNFRSVYLHPRNLSDDLAKEIAKRKGLVGIVYYPLFSGCKKELLYEQVIYGKELVGEDHLAIGSDFFCPTDPGLSPDRVPFFVEYNDASSHQKFLQDLALSYTLSDTFLQKLSYQNGKRFLDSFYLPNIQ